MTSKLAAVLLLALAAIAAQANTFFLTSEWLNKNYERMCQYENGTVINVGYGLCTPTIEG